MAICCRFDQITPKLHLYDPVCGKPKKKIHRETCKKYLRAMNLLGIAISTSAGSNGSSLRILKELRSSPSAFLGASVLDGKSLLQAKKKLFLIGNPSFVNWLESVHFWKKSNSNQFTSWDFLSQIVASQVLSDVP